ncbi:hypothetical protein [Kitasatospora sp. NPDC093558]|uniref:hypothetical protein n=1 Tax=Kitasatospora sp. NPDC093558 TaxID=3155201 RepID=UPI00341979E5
MHMHTDVDRDLILRARMRLISHDTRILHAPAGLDVHRPLFTVNPHVYATRLANALEESSHSPQLTHLPKQRQALLHEALTTLTTTPPHHPHHTKIHA